MSEQRIASKGALLRRGGGAGGELDLICCLCYCRGVLTVRASTDSSSDSDSVTRWWTHSSATESYSFFFEPSEIEVLLALFAFASMCIDYCQ